MTINLEKEKYCGNKPGTNRLFFVIFYFMQPELSWFAEYPRLTFNAYSHYLKAIYYQPVYRVSVDAGFRCPHRERDANTTGCIYCGATGSRAPYLADENEVKRQIESSIGFLKKRYKAHQFILYFQAFSNTYASLEKLKSVYDSALRCAPFRELIISTRPDCIDADIAALIASYRQQGLKVWVELGLQSASDTTLRRINRGHTVSDFTKAFRLLRSLNILIAVHLIFGLPGEGDNEIGSTIGFVSALKPDGVKIHNLDMVRSSPLFEEFVSGEITTLCEEQHRDYVIKALEHLPKETVIMRLTSDTPAMDCANPHAIRDKAGFYESVRQEMAGRNTWQGKLGVQAVGTG